MVEGRVAATVAAVKGEEATVAATVVGRAVEGREAVEREVAPEADSAAEGMEAEGRAEVAMEEVATAEGRVEVATAVARVVEARAEAETVAGRVVVDSVACA